MPIGKDRRIERKSTVESDYHQTGQIPGLVGSMKPESGGGPDQAPREIRLTFTIVKKKRTFKNTTASGALAPRNQSSPCS